MFGLRCVLQYCDPINMCLKSSYDLVLFHRRIVVCMIHEIAIDMSSVDKSLILSSTCSHASKVGFQTATLGCSHSFVNLHIIMRCNLDFGNSSIIKEGIAWDLVHN